METQHILDLDAHKIFCGWSDIDGNRTVISCIYFDDGGTILARGLAIRSPHDFPFKAMGQSYAEDRAKDAWDASHSLADNLRSNYNEIRREEATFMLSMCGLLKKFVTGKLPPEFRYKAQTYPERITRREEKAVHAFLRKKLLKIA